MKSFSKVKNLFLYVTITLEIGWRDSKGYIVNIKATHHSPKVLISSFFVLEVAFLD